LRCFIEILQSGMGGSTAGTAQYSPEAPITQERWRRGRHFRADGAAKWRASESDLRARTVRSAMRRWLRACAPRPQVNARCAKSCATLRRWWWVTDGASPRPRRGPGLARFRSPVERRTLVDRHGLRVSHSAESEIAQSGAHLLPRIPQLFVTRPAGRFLDYVGRASVGQAGRRDLEFRLAGRTCSAVVAGAKSFAAIEQWVRDAAQDTLARLGARTVSVFGVRVRRVGRRSAGSFRVPAPAAWPIRWEASRTGAGRWPWTVGAPAARAMAPPQRPDRHPAAGSGQDERNHLPRHLVGALRPDRGHRYRRRPAHPAR
jgi:hypothetical protein